MGWGRRRDDYILLCVLAAICLRPCAIGIKHDICDNPCYHRHQLRALTPDFTRLVSLPRCLPTPLTPTTALAAFCMTAKKQLVVPRQVSYAVAFRFCILPLAVLPPASSSVPVALHAICGDDVAKPYTSGASMHIQSGSYWEAARETGRMDVLATISPQPCQPPTHLPS